MCFEDRHLDRFDFIADAFRADRPDESVLATECAALYYNPDDNAPPETQGNNGPRIAIIMATALSFRARNSLPQQR